MDAAERESVVAYLERTRDEMLGLATRLTAEQREFRDGSNRWSVADCMEHIVVTETAIRKQLERVLAGPPDVEHRGSTAHKDTILTERVAPRRGRAQAPEAAHPAGRWPDFGELSRRFEETRAATIALARNSEADLRCYFFPHPILKDLDVYQWLVFFAAHTERHLKQAEEVLGSADVAKAAGEASA
ncbi:MAG TPA: DinB family protein [Bryobacteraceae bacterium]|nr:DinB family protein [Bryobacteraceae bacterium]